MSVDAWVAATKRRLAHDWVIVVVPRQAAVIAANTLDALWASVGPQGRRPEVIGVVEATDGRAGNLGGTARAWRQAVRRAPGLPAAVRDGASVLMLHDAGAASRSAPWAMALDGRRGDLRMPRNLLVLRDAIVRQLAPLAPSGRGHIDVAWTSQLFLPDLDPDAVPAPSHDLTKLVAPWRGDPPEVAVRELGWFRRAPALGFSPAGTFADQDAWRAAHEGAEPAADVGTFRVTLDLMERLARVDLPSPVDVDPGLTAPALDPRRLGPVLAALGDAPSVGVLPLGDLRWWRLRRAREVLTMLTDVYRTPALQALLDLEHPVNGCTLGGVEVVGPEISWEEMEAGVVVGGVRLRRSILSDCELAAGSAVEDSVATLMFGRAHLAGSAAIIGSDVDATDALVMQTNVPIQATSEVVIGMYVPGAWEHLRLGIDADPRPVDGVVVPPNRMSFAEARRLGGLDGGDPPAHPAP